MSPVIWPPHHDPVDPLAGAIVSLLTESSSHAKVDGLEESFVGKPPRLVESLALAYELAIIERSLEASPLRTAILREVEKLAQKAVTAATEKAKTATVR